MILVNDHNIKEQEIQGDWSEISKLLGSEKNFMVNLIFKVSLHTVVRKSFQNTTFLHLQT